MSKWPATGIVLWLRSIQAAHHTNLAVGCYCENPNYCHRSLLAEQLAKLGLDWAMCASRWELGIRLGLRNAREYPT